MPIFKYISLQLDVVTVQGDADLYVSSEIDHPTFYLEVVL